jgi:hypothetical protein
MKFPSKGVPDRTSGAPIAIVWKSREMRPIQACGNANAEHQGTVAFSGQVHQNIGAIRIAALPIP